MAEMPTPVKETSKKKTKSCKSAGCCGFGDLTCQEIDENSYIRKRLYMTLTTNEARTIKKLKAFCSGRELLTGEVVKTEEQAVRYLIEKLGE